MNTQQPDTRFVTILSPIDDYQDLGEPTKPHFYRALTFPEREAIVITLGRYNPTGRMYERKEIWRRSDCKDSLEDVL